MRPVGPLLPLALLILAWAAVYSSALFLDHLTLRTNAFDLSVFDYALWSTTHGPRLGFAPFYGQSLLSHHFMPTLWLLWPLHALLPSPLLLIAVQLCAIGAAAVYLAYRARRRLPPLAAFAVVAAFLFSRRAHGATTSVFYVECFEPILIFGLAWAATARNWRVYWTCLGLALGCKEDVAIYTATYGCLLALDRATRRTGLLTTVVSIAWLLMTVTLAIPWARAVDGLPADYAFVARYGDSPLLDSLAQLARWESLRRLASLTLMVGLLCWIRPKWMLAAMPGIVLNLAVQDEALQSGLIGHYLWPILPFLFLATLDSAEYVHTRSPMLLRVWAVALLAAIVIDNPTLRPSYFMSRVRDYEAAAAVRGALAALPSSASVLSQPQLVPHIAKRHGIATVGGIYQTPGAPPDVVVLSPMGDQWPLTSEDFVRIVGERTADPHYVRTDPVEDLVMFVRQPVRIGGS
jgi:uncharacterized membrane protein